jgi:uncharacterized protein
MHSFDQALTEGELSELEGYLGSEALPEACMDLEMLDGFLAAVVVGPEPIVPSEWLPLALGFLDEGDEELRFRDEREGERILQLVMRYYNSIAIVLQEVPDSYAPLFYETPEDPDEDDVPVGMLWAEGFLAGVAMRQDDWQPLVDDEEATELTMPILALAAPEDDPELGSVAREPEARRQLIEFLPGTVISIRDYWRTRLEANTPGSRS